MIIKDTVLRQIKPDDKLWLQDEKEIHLHNRYHTRQDIISSIIVSVPTDNLSIAVLI